MDFGWLQIAVVAVAVAARLLAGGRLHDVTVTTYGVPLVLLLGPLALAGQHAPVLAHPVLIAADACVLVAALLFPDFGESGRYQIPLLMLLRGEPALASGNRIAPAFLAVGALALTVYLILLAALWIVIALS
ncbi:hypothetical protein [Nocardia jiangsuensis]|uniref:Prepilin type IV endopeptidase peptidase domain-containing protein n=1 Tax=Nocardia jiangsuensis TaxID=1691563 RepID=A0ABV8E2Q2_9NOCA